MITYIHRFVDTNCTRSFMKIRYYSVRVYVSLKERVNKSIYKPGKNIQNLGESHFSRIKHAYTNNVVCM